MDLHVRIEDAIQSLFLEEYRGDLRQAYNEILQYESESETSTDLEQTAYLLQSKIRVCTLRGRLHDAYQGLDEFKILVDRHILGSTTEAPTTKLASYWGLRYAACKAFVDYHRRYPPCLRYQHEPQSPTNKSMIGSMAGPNDITTELSQTVQRYSATIAEEHAATLQTEFQVCLLLQVLVSFPYQLRFLATRHPSYPDGSWKKANDGKSPEDAIEAASPYLHKFVGIKAMEEEENTTTLYFRRLYIEIHYALDSTSKEALLQRLYNAYERLEDKTGMANCKLIEADSLLSPPFTSPISQNLIPVPSTASGGHNIWDAIEAKLSLKQSDKANQCYEAALQLFQDSNSPRGQAAVLLRQASIMHDRACSLEFRNSERIPLLEAASKKYERCLALFDMDEANIQIVKANQILLDISRGQYFSKANADLKTRAAEIGKWGLECQNELVSYHIGRLMIRFARREWQKYSRFDTANACYECAYECCMALGALVPAFVTVMSRAEMQDEMNNYVASTVLAEQCIAMVDSVVESLGQRVDTIVQDDDPMRQLERRHMLNEKYMFISTFNQAVNRVLSRTNAFDTGQNWEKKFLWYSENDESFAFLRAKPSDNNQNSKSMVDKSDIAKRTFGVSFDKIMEVAAIEDAITKKFRATVMQFNKCISDGDLAKAESAIYGFIRDSSQEFRRMYTRDLFQMLAYGRIADTLKIREILDSLTDEELFNGHLEEFLNGKNVDYFFSSIANNALYACVIAEDWKRGLRVLDLVLKIRPKFMEESPTESLVSLSLRLVSAASIYLNNEQSELAFRLLLKARQITELGRSQASDVDVKVGALYAGRSAESFLLLVGICLRCAELELPVSIIDGYDHAHPRVTWEEHALLFMEEARARSLIDSLLSLAEKQSNEEEKRRISESIYKRRALTHLNSIPKRTAQQDQELEELIEEIKDLEIGTWSSSANDLMNTLNSELVPRDLFSHLNEDAVAIEASFSRSGCILMAVTNQGIQSYQRNPVRDTDIRKLVMEVMQIMRDMDGLRNNPEETRRKARVEELSGQISDIVLTPFADIIRQKHHIIFSISQPLTAFPFSALVFDGKPLFLHAAVSQTPSLTALYHLSKRRAESSVPTVSVFTKAVSYEEPTVSKDGRASRERRLPMAGVEAISISNMFSTWPIEASTLSRTQFRDYIQGQTSILHIGTHGTLDAENPLLSSISIGEDFRVLDMSSIQSGANLLVFAACLSGLGQATAGNDVLGFTHVVLGTGCQAYIGTLFEVSDFASMVLMTLFYRQIKNGPAGLSLAEALRRAQVEFCRFDDSKAALFLDGLLEAWDDDASGSSGGSPDGSKSPTDIVPDGKYLLTLQKMLLPRIDWTSPIFWASFVLMGYGDFCFT